MTDYLLHIITTQIKNQGQYTYLESLFSQFEDYLYYTFQSSSKYPGLKVYFGSKSNMLSSIQNTLLIFSKCFNEEYWARYNKLKSSLK